MKRSALVLLVIGCGLSADPAAADVVPGGLESAGLTRIVPDTVFSDNGTLKGMNNWEPYVSMMGNAVFLIQGNTYALKPDGSISPLHQRHALTFQKVEGGVTAKGDVFFGDDLAPYRQTINTSRQDGNPGRVAGDARPGSVYLMAGGETTAHYWGPAPAGVFYSAPDRWSLGLVRGALDRYATVQTYWLDPVTLKQMPALSMAQDAIYGRRTSGDPVDAEVAKFGGDIIALSNGNFVVLTDDRAQLLAPYRTPTAAIFNREGQVVKEAWAINPGVSSAVWSNLAAYDGGFCVRFAGYFYFHDNAGNLVGTVAQQDPNLKDPLGTPVTMRTDRGDEHRIAGHVNSRYVFLGSNWHNPAIDKDVVGLAVWDAQTRSFVAYTNVNEMTPANGGTDAADFFPEHAGGGDADRVHVAVDALNRVVVSYEVTLPAYAITQVVCRVLAFDPNTQSFSYLTPSFFPFINHATSSPTLGIRSWRPSVAMTTKQICVAAAGEINWPDNNPLAGKTTPPLANFYTVFAHPDPQEDPTPPAYPPGNCPTVTSVTPAFASTKIGIAHNVEVSGTHFVPGATSVSLRLRGHPHVIVPASAVAVSAGGTRLTFDLDPSTGDSATYNLFVSIAGSGCPPVELHAGFIISECYVPFADANGDGCVDQTDFAEYQRCVTSGGGSVSPDCKCLNRDGDSDVDLTDFAAFVNCATGPGIKWTSALAPACVP